MAKLPKLSKLTPGSSSQPEKKDLRPGSSPSKDATDIETPKRIGVTIFFLIFVVFGMWAALAPLRGAVLGAGTVEVKSQRQVVQHLEGGIVRAINVRDGDRVEAGEVLMELDRTQSLSQLDTYVSQLNALLAQEARLVAERDNQEKISFPVSLMSLESGGEVMEEVQVQQHLFETRSASLNGAIDVLEQRISQLSSQLNGMRAQRESKLDLATSYAEEIDDVRSLLADGFSDRNRLRELERNAATLRGDAAELEASISSTEIQIGETRMEILQQQREFQNEIAQQLSEVQTRISDTQERITALRDIVSRTTIRAPVNGVVNGMKVHTIGGVISPGMEIADIVPQGDELIVEARIMPVDIDRVSIDQEATIRFSAFGNAVPSIYGRVIHVSADSFIDENTGAPYYTARIEVTAEGMEELGDLVLVPGMPSDVFITTGSRTLLQYMLKPISNALARSFIED